MVGRVSRSSVRQTGSPPRAGRSSAVHRRATSPGSGVSTLNPTVTGTRAPGATTPSPAPSGSWPRLTATTSQGTRSTVISAGDCGGECWGPSRTKGSGNRNACPPARSSRLALTVASTRARTLPDRSPPSRQTLPALRSGASAPGEPPGQATASTTRPSETSRSTSAGSFAPAAGVDQAISTVSRTGRSAPAGARPVGEGRTAPGPPKRSQARAVNTLRHPLRMRKTTLPGSSGAPRPRPCRHGRPRPETLLDLVSIGREEGNELPERTFPIIPLKFRRKSQSNPIRLSQTSGRPTLTVCIDEKSRPTHPRTSEKARSKETPCPAPLGRGEGCVRYTQAVVHESGRRQTRDGALKALEKTGP